MKLNEFIGVIGTKAKQALDAVTNVLSEAVAAITKVEDEIKTVEKEIDQVEASIPPGPLSSPVPAVPPVVLPPIVPTTVSPDGPAKK